MEKTQKQKLIDKIYKLLPIYEGKLIGTDEVIEVEKAYKNFQTNVTMVVNYMLGIVRLNGTNEILETAILSLIGIKTIGPNNKENHDVVQKTIYKCIKNLEKLGDNIYGDKF